jgi:hypothetical protein
VTAVRRLADPEPLGLDNEALHGLADAVTARPDQVRAEIAGPQRLMTESGPGTHEKAAGSRSAPTTPRAA